MPETGNDRHSSQSDEWNHSLHGDYLWSSVNFGEAVTEVMTPLTWSVIRFTLDDWMFLPGMPTVGVIGGRPYLNISIFATLFYGIGRSRQDLLDYMEGTLYMRLPEDMAIPRVPVSRGTLLRGLLYALQVQWRQRRGLQKTPAYLATNKAWFERTRSLLQAQRTPAGLYDLWHAKMRDHVKQGVWCVLGSVDHSTAYMLQLRRRLAETAGPADANILIANVGDQGTPLDSVGPVLELASVAQGELSRTAYLEKYGHRGAQEFELSVPRPAEDPQWLEQELQRIAQAPVDVAGLLARQRQAFAAAWQRLQARSPQAARRFRPQIAESARRAQLREATRSAYVRDRWSIRLFALRAGELTGLNRQVFFLTLPELLALLAGNSSVTRAIDSRMGAYQRYKALPPYPAVIRGPFDPFAWAANPHRPTAIFDAQQPAEKQSTQEQVVGSPGSAGIVEGIVRIVNDPAGGERLQHGEILVAVQTDIAWTLLFPRAAAVVTDVGAPLSHAAIVARELGIPAVVGCGNATAILKSGDRVRVDGSRGLVVVLSN